MMGKLPFMHLLRKLKTAYYIVARCSNWPALLCLRLGLSTTVNHVILRHGPILRANTSLRQAWGEIFEPAIADVYGIRRTTADIIIDIGGNIGSFSTLASWHNPQARLYTFEPNPVVADQAKINFRNNCLTNITLIESPVTKDGRTVEFHISTNESGGNSSLFLGEVGQAVTIKSTSLDSISFATASSAFFKIDCEGAEGELIEWIAANRAKLPARVKIVCEYHHWCPTPLADLVTLLRQVHFKVETRTRFDELYIHAADTSSPH